MERGNVDVSAGNWVGTQAGSPAKYAEEGVCFGFFLLWGGVL